MYPYAKDPNNKPYPGNLKYNAEKNIVETVEQGNKDFTDEIDVLYITKRKIFVIECKTRSGTWRLEDDWVYKGNAKDDKNPEAQTEKHCRHLYHTIWEYLPNGDPSYIVPILVYASKTKLIDNRTDKISVYATILNSLTKLVLSLDKSDYGLNVPKITEKLKKCGTIKGGECK